MSHLSLCYVFSWFSATDHLFLPLRSTLDYNPWYQPQTGNWEHPSLISSSKISYLFSFGSGSLHPSSSASPSVHADGFLHWDNTFQLTTCYECLSHRRMWIATWIAKHYLSKILPLNIKLDNIYKPFDMAFGIEQVIASQLLRHRFYNL